MKINIIKVFELMAKINGLMEKLPYLFDPMNPVEEVKTTMKVGSYKGRAIRATITLELED